MNKKIKVDQVRMLILFTIVMTSFFMFPIRVSAASTLKGIVSISGNTVTYINNIDDQYREQGGYRPLKRGKLAKNAKFYWHKPRSNKFNRVSKKIFIKRINYNYRAESNRYGEKKKKGDWCLCRIKFKKGKISKIYAVWTP